MKYDIGGFIKLRNICKVLLRDTRCHFKTRASNAFCWLLFRLMFILLQLNHNVKQVSWYQTRGPNRVTLTLKDSSVVMMDKLSLLVAKKMKEYLETVRLGKPAGMFLLTCVFSFHITVHSFSSHVKFCFCHFDLSLVLKTNQGSASFGLVLGNRAAQNDSSPSEKQVAQHHKYWNAYGFFSKYYMINLLFLSEHSKTCKSGQQRGQHTKKASRESQPGNFHTYPQWALWEQVCKFRFRYSVSRKCAPLSYVVCLHVISSFSNLMTFNLIKIALTTPKVFIL